MYRGARELVVRRPTAAVFDYLADPRNLPHWNRQVARVELLTAAPSGAGTRFRSYHRCAARLEFEIVSYQRPERVLLLAHGRRLDLLVELQIKATPGGSLARFRLEARPRGRWRLLMPLRAWRFRRESAGQLSALRRALEARPIVLEREGLSTTEAHAGGERRGRREDQRGGSQ